MTSATDGITLPTLDRKQIRVFFGHRRTRSTVAIITSDGLFLFEVPLSEASQLQDRLNADVADGATVLDAFIVQWRTDRSELSKPEAKHADRRPGRLGRKLTQRPLKVVTTNI